MYSVYQHWDPLKVCIVGKSYSPKFYSFIKNEKVRAVMERIARETEEDYQKLIALLESLGVEVLRPNVSDDYTDYLVHGKILPPPMTPRDYSIMLGEEFHFKTSNTMHISPVKWDTLRGDDWPLCPPANLQELLALPEFVKIELITFAGEPVNNFKKYTNRDKKIFDWGIFTTIDKFTWGDILTHLLNKGVPVYNSMPDGLGNLNAAMVSRIGKDLYVGTDELGENKENVVASVHRWYDNYRCKVIDTGGHSDGTYCPVVPGLIISLDDITTYVDTFPGWEVVYLPGQSWAAVKPFLQLKNKNQGKWWVPGEELNDEFTNFVEEWLGHWVGFVEETVFDVNMLVIDEKNVVCNNYNKEVFDAFDRHGVTPHIVNFRHRYFWDGGLHCITSDIHREGTMKNYFPERD